MAKNWLQVGPFLEVSFLGELSEGREQIARTLIDKLYAIPFSINIMDQNIDELITGFEAGYPNDEEDLQSAFMHTLEFRIEADIAGKRRGVLYAEQLSSDTLLVVSRFFGSQFDASEWNQFGVKNNDLKNFIEFLTSLYNSFEFIVGAVAVDEDIRELIDHNKIWQDKGYRFENLFVHNCFQPTESFYALLWNENYGKPQNVPAHHKRIEKTGVLSIYSDFYSEF